MPETEISEALRTFNTHVNRVEVLTYKELLDNAHRALGTQKSAGTGPSVPALWPDVR
ncbi:hypothetical protein [Streptomyces sp. NPDC056240]|uniref:hypothetical protein n=1 Tax=Streptomyces sp. NPDC056240 TaxID=3345759 RepID=UPI0035E157E3